MSSMATVTVDGQPAHVSETIWRPAPLRKKKKNSAFIISRNGYKNTDVEEEVSYGCCGDLRCTDAGRHFIYNDF